MTSSDDRWNLKGSDPEAIEAFRETKQEYQARAEGRVTNDDALLMLIEGVDVEPAVDYDRVREIVREVVREENRELLKTVTNGGGPY